MNPCRRQVIRDEWPAILGDHGPRGSAIRIRDFAGIWRAADKIVYSYRVVG